MKALTPEQLQKIEAIFDGALEQDPAARNDFLDEACAGDGTLRSAVDSLIQSYKRAGDFLETPVVEEVCSPTASQALPDCIAHYQIIREIGRGGMGEVFLAHDTRLERPVALKILPPQFIKNPQQVKRFEREARAASALNHPNIITIHEIVQQGDTHFIATEYIEGQTLRQKLADGKLSLHEALDIALQIARALRAAHAARIIHRDIKPENIMVRDDGLVKVLDFGLAKPVAGDASAGGCAVLPANDLHTNPETFMGTVGYMSPEQVLRKTVDHRTDIFSTGIVMYEMLCGERPFKGKSAADTLQAVLHTDAAPLQIDHPPFAELVHRALQKDTESRYQTADQLFTELKQLARQLNSGKELPAAKPEPATSSWKGRALWATVGVLVLTAFVYLTVRLNRKPLTVPPSAVIALAAPLTQSQALEYFPSFSPDGQSIVFESFSDNTSDIYLQRLGDRNAINLTEDYLPFAGQPAYAPDGEHIAFESAGIWMMNARGKDFIKLTEEGFHPAWSPDSKEIVYALERTIDSDRASAPSPLWIVNVATRDNRLLKEGYAVQPSWSPHGQRIAYWNTRHGGQRDIWTIAANGENVVAVTDDEFEDWGPVWSPDGKYLYFISNRGGGSMNLWRIAIDEQTGAVSQRPEPVTTPAVSCKHICFSRDGKRLAYVQVSKKGNVNRLAFDPSTGKVLGEPVSVTQGSGFATEPAVSSDSQWLVYNTIGDKQEDLFAMDLAVKVEGKKAPPLQLTNDPFKDRSPRSSPDAQKIIFFSDRGGDYQLWQINRDGSELQQLTFAKDGGIFCPVWSPEGSRIAYCLSNGKITSTYIINANEGWADQTPQVLPHSDARVKQFLPSSWSADGLKLAGWQYWTERGRAGVYVYSFASKNYERWTEFGTFPVWLSDNRRLLFYMGDKIYLIDEISKTPKPIHTVNSIAWTDLAGLTLSKDDRQIYYSQVTTEADIWIADIR
jgi:serine/threonine protein kinase/dipeptidyl aminopeptidase/acylaminoacyl peptidase